MLKSLIKLYEDKAVVCKGEIVKIMVSMREVEMLLQEFSKLALQ